MMGKFLTTTSAAGDHSVNHATCGACKKEKAMITLIGGKEMDSLFKHVGKVVEGDKYEEAVEKVRQGITASTNQAMARFRLMREMPQAGEVFSVWWPKVKEQADRCI